MYIQYICVCAACMCCIYCYDILLTRRYLNNGCCDTLRLIGLISVPAQDEAATEHRSADSDSAASSAEGAEALP